MDNEEKSKIGRIIILILGCISIIVGIFFQTIAAGDLYQNAVVLMGLEAFVTPDTMIFHQVFYILSRILLLAGGVLLAQNRKVARYLILAGGILGIKDFGLIALIILLIFIKKEE